MVYELEKNLPLVQSDWEIVTTNKTMMPYLSARTILPRSPWTAALDYTAWAQLGLPTIRRSKGCSITICPNFYFPVVDASRCVVFIHDFGHLTNPAARGIIKSYGQVLDVYTKLAVQRAGLLIVPSHHIAAELEARYGPISSPVSVISLGISKTFQTPSPMTNSLPTELSQDSPYLLLTSMSDRKRLPFLIRIIERLVKELPEIQVVITGGNPNWVADSLSSSDYSEHIKYLGFVSDEHLASLYQHAGAVCILSTTEAFGISALEAMSMGVPVIVADAGASPEIVADAAIKVPPNNVEAWVNQILRVLSDQSFRSELIKRGEKHAAKYTWQQTAKDLASEINANFGII